MSDPTANKLTRTLPNPMDLLQVVGKIAKSNPDHIALNRYVLDNEPHCIVGRALADGFNWTVDDLLDLKDRFYHNLYSESAEYELTDRESKCLEAIDIIQESQDIGCEWYPAYLEAIGQINSQEYYSDNYDGDDSDE